MPTELAHLYIKSESDILPLHQLALKVADWAGLSPAEQICFAVNVSNHSFTITGDGEQIVFSLNQQTNSKYFLQAEMKNKCYVVEKELPHLTHANSLPVFREKTCVGKNEWERYQDMQQFTFALAHDLKNSLTKLKLSLTLLKEEEIPSPINNYIQIIHRSADRLETIMLSLNKIIEVGDASPHVVKNISPALIFSDVYDEFSDTLEKNGAFVNTDFTGIGQLNYIEVYLKSIFTNLLSNAIKYSSTERSLYLTVLATQKEGNAIFTFTDNGQGIDLEKFGNKLFLPFTRFSSNTDGSGVGLYLIKNIVERNGGSIEVESIPGKGTTFTVTIREYKLPV